MTTTNITPDKPLSLIEEVRRDRAIQLPAPEHRRGIRDAAKVSTRRLARELRITHGSIYYYERGGNPGPEIAARYRDLLLRLAAEVGYKVPELVQK
jgi:hypothetical protein